MFEYISNLIWDQPIIKMKVLQWTWKFEIRAYKWHLQSNMSLISIKIDQSFYYWKFQTKIKIMEHSIMNSHIPALSIRSIFFHSYSNYCSQSSLTHTPHPLPRLFWRNLRHRISSLNILAYVWYVIVIPKNTNNSFTLSEVLPRIHMYSL